MFNVRQPPGPWVLSSGNLVAIWTPANDKQPCHAATTVHQKNELNAEKDPLKLTSLYAPVWLILKTTAKPPTLLSRSLRSSSFFSLERESMDIDNK